MATKANIGILVPSSYESYPPKMAEFARFFSAALKLARLALKSTGSVAPAA